MSECSFETRSQYSILDDNIENSFCSKPRNCKYFARKALDTSILSHGITLLHNPNTKDYSKMPSATSRKVNLIRERIDNAFFKSPVGRNSEDVNSQNSSITCSRVSMQEAISTTDTLRIPIRSFQKKKIPVEANAEEAKINLNNKENAELLHSQVQYLRVENKKLREEVAQLVEECSTFKEQLHEVTDLKAHMSELQVRLFQSQSQHLSLQDQIQHLKDSHTQTCHTLDSIYGQSIKSLNQINNMLKDKLQSLQQEVKYAGIEITVLRKRCPTESVVQLIDERNRLKEKNRDLRVEVLRHRHKMEEEMFDLSPASTDRSC